MQLLLVLLQASKKYPSPHKHHATGVGVVLLLLLLLERQLPDGKTP
jgi:hypothetical protein